MAMEITVIAAAAEIIAAACAAEIQKAGADILRTRFFWRNNVVRTTEREKKESGFSCSFEKKTCIFRLMGV